MKKFFLLIVFTLVVALMSYATNKEHHYGFILSCGKTVYRSFNYELSKKEFLELTDRLEELYCGSVSHSTEVNQNLDSHV